MRFITNCYFFFALGLGFSVSAQTLTTSELPIVLLETGGAEIPNEPKIAATMKVIYNGPGMLNAVTDAPNAYNGDIGIEVRGSSSAYMPQRPYAIETRDAFGGERVVPLLGMPEESDWCLISHYNEKTLTRNPLSYHLFEEMGNYATRGQLVEVVLNGQYEGIYLLCERIKRDPNRVAVSKADPNALGGDELTGGYIFKVDYAAGNDYFVSQFKPFGHDDIDIKFVFHYPKVADLTNAQRDYLEDYVYRAELALFTPQFKDPVLGYRRYFDQSSFIDYFLVNELARNNDGSKKSRYFYKDRNSKDSLIHAGPVWDFDWAWKDILECDIFAATDGSGWSYRINDCYPDNYSPDWYTRMLQDPTFADSMCSRYWALREGIFSQQYLYAYIDSVAHLVTHAQQRHYQRWPILGYGNWTPEAGIYPPTYAGEITKFKGWIERRLTWLDANIPTLCPGFSGTDTANQSQSLKVYPNPTTGAVSLEGIAQQTDQIFCTNVLGQTQALAAVWDNGTLRVDLKNRPNGLYLLWTGGTQPLTWRVIKF